MVQTETGETRTRLHDLQAIGQSVWYDSIRRGLMTSGEFEQLINAGISGVTSNPTIFGQAIAGSVDYDAALQTMLDLDVADIFEALAVQDIRDAADMLRPIYDRTGGRDGFASIEVSPRLAHDTAGSVEEARRLWRSLGRPNVMVKIPATAEGIPAIAQLTSEGINVNITLIFALSAYERVMDAYLEGLERRVAAGELIERIASVASFFVSRVDTAVDRLLDARSRTTTDPVVRERLGRLRGQAGIANAVQAYARFRAAFSGPRFAALAARGAMVQRPLWASTGTKDPAYPDTYYVQALAGPDTVDTMPPATVTAFLDHGRIASRLDDVAWANEAIGALPNAGVELDQVTAELLDEGIASFAKSFETLLACITAKRDAFRAGGVERQRVALGDALRQVEQALDDLRARKAVSRLWARDPSLWKEDPDHQREIKERLGWLTVADAMMDQVPELEAFVREVRWSRIEHVVLCGMGGSSLCPEVLRRTFGSAPGYPQLWVLDSTDPATIAGVAQQVDPEQGLFVIASKSGGTIEVDSLFRYFFERARPALQERASGQFVAITDPGTSLEQLARERGFRRVFLNPPDIGGRYSALSLFGLVPAALIGLNLSRLLERADRMAHACEACVPAEANPGLCLGAALGSLARTGRDKVTLLTSPRFDSVGIWIEQLLAESTGKEGRGIVPVAGEPPGAPSDYGDDRFFVYLRLATEDNTSRDRVAAALEAAGQPVLTLHLEDAYDLGGEFFRWEFATAIAGAILAIDAFDQPNVQESKDNTARILRIYQEEGRLPTELPDVVDGDLQLYGVTGSSVRDALAAFLGQCRPGDYLALMAYLEIADETDGALMELRRRLRDRTRLATTLGYGPRFLHSTGQLHKGGPNTGLFIQITAGDELVVPIPSRPYDFGTLKAAQALGDWQALHQHGRRAIRAHLGRDISGGLARLAAALE